MWLTGKNKDRQSLFCLCKRTLTCLVQVRTDFVSSTESISPLVSYDALLDRVTPAKKFPKKNRFLGGNGLQKNVKSSGRLGILNQLKTMKLWTLDSSQTFRVGRIWPADLSIGDFLSIFFFSVGSSVATGSLGWTLSW